MDHLDRIRDTKTARDRAIANFHDAVAEAVRAEVPVKDVVAASGYHRNHVARIARAHGVPDQRHRSKRKRSSSPN